MTCLKARDDVQRPAGLAVSIGVTPYNVLATVAIIRTAYRAWGLLLWGAGIVHFVFGVLFFAVFAGTKR